VKTPTGVRNLAGQGQVMFKLLKQDLKKVILYSKLEKHNSCYVVYVKKFLEGIIWLFVWQPW